MAYLVNVAVYSASAIASACLRIEIVMTVIKRRRQLVACWYTEPGTHELYHVFTATEGKGQL